MKRSPTPDPLGASALVYQETISPPQYQVLKSLWNTCTLTLPHVD